MAIEALLRTSAWCFVGTLLLDAQIMAISCVIIFIHFPDSYLMYNNSPQLTKPPRAILDAASHLPSRQAF